MKLLITGGNGMLGRTLRRRFSPRHEVFSADLPDVDVTSKQSLDEAFAAFRPDAVIHCAAMTKVDDCESNEEFAFRLNGMGSANVARACAAGGARLISISTDYVFDGRREEGAYAESDATFPCTVYGKSKLAGERSVMDILPSATILRIAWLYGPGGPSFVHTMARLGAQEGPPLKVVDDQHGNPTSTDVVADALEFLLERPEITGVVHGTCEGTCTWHGLASELFRILKLKRQIVPCSTEEFPRPAPRPANSALAKTVLAAHGFTMPRWQDALARFLGNPPSVT